MKKFSLLTLAGACLLSSCAYMQTNQNIRHSQDRYEGCQLKKDELQLYNKGNQWYLAAPLCTFSRSLPVIHDDILLTEHNEPTYTVLEKKQELCYMPISAGTATCLRMQDGYAHLEDLVTEINSFSGQEPWLTSLKGASSHRIEARLESADSVPTPARLITKSEPSLLLKSIAAVDFVLVDIPGTVLYNIAIPVMAPVVFFHEFLNEE